jgi:hypothetical protein
MVPYISRGLKRPLYLFIQFPNKIEEEVKRTPSGPIFLKSRYSSLKKI